jgi:septal ring factor EnvC (AmiA/AmiB activator)
MFNNKKKYFKAMLSDIEKAIWEVEFRKFTAMNEREAIRRQYDQAQDALTRMKAQPTPKEGLTEKQKSEIDLAERYVAQLTRELKAIDDTIVGGQPSEELPNGAEGLDSKLKAWVGRREYIKSFIKTNC